MRGAVTNKGESLCESQLLFVSPQSIYLSIYITYLRAPDAEPAPTTQDSLSLLRTHEVVECTARYTNAVIGPLEPDRARAACAERAFLARSDG